MNYRRLTEEKYLVKAEHTQGLKHGPKIEGEGRGLATKSQHVVLGSALGINYKLVSYSHKYPHFVCIQFHMIH